MKVYNMGVDIGLYFLLKFHQYICNYYIFVQSLQYYNELKPWQTVFTSIPHTECLAGLLWGKHTNTGEGYLMDFISIPTLAAPPEADAPL